MFSVYVNIYKECHLPCDEEGYNIKDEELHDGKVGSYIPLEMIKY